MSLEANAPPGAVPTRFRLRWMLAALLLASAPALAAWQVVALEPGKRVEIDRQSIVVDAKGETRASGRIVMDRPIVDPKTSAAYRIIEVENRYDCGERTHATLKRSYYRDEGDLLRQEEARNPFDMPVRSGTPDDRLLREVCRPKAGAPALAEASKLAERVSLVAGDLRRVNEALIEREVKREIGREVGRQARPGAPAPASAARPRPSAPSPASDTPWAYAGAGGPEHWGRLKTDYATCASGRRQSPIDLQGGIAVDLEPIAFDYRPASFRVVDSGRHLQMAVYGGAVSLLGKNYELQRIVFHRPAEMTVAGKSFAMDAQLVHKAGDGKLLILAVLLEQGPENPLVQSALNHLPLEAGGDVLPPSQSVDPSRLLPGDRRYFTFMGSLTSPPCSEDVLWVVMKEPQAVSAEQLSIFARLYPANARPLQPSFGRIIKESR